MLIGFKGKAKFWTLLNQSVALPRAIRPRNEAFHFVLRVLPEGSILCNDAVSLLARSPHPQSLPDLFQGHCLPRISSIAPPIWRGKEKFLFLFSLIIYRRNFTSQSIVIDKIFVEIIFLNFFNRFKFHKIERWIVNVSIIEYLHTTISVSGPTIFCHLALMAARIWGVSSLDGSLSNASTLAASSNSSDDLSRSPSWRIALSTVVCDSPSGSISVVVSPSCNGIFYTHCHWIKIRCIKNIVKKYWI